MASLIAEGKPIRPDRCVLPSGDRRRQPVAGLGQLELDGGEAVVLRDALTACGCPTLNLTAAGADSEVGDERIGGFPGAVRDHLRVPPARHRGDRVEGLADGADLV